MAIVGDGSAMYSIQALWTAAHLKLPITYVIANNRSYRILEGAAQVDAAAASASSAWICATRRSTSWGWRNPSACRRGASPSPTKSSPALRAAMASGAPSLLDVRIADGFGG